MKRYLLLPLALALAAVSYAQVPQSSRATKDFNDQTELTASQRLVNSVFAGTAQVDHIASLEGFDYYIYVDHSVSPPAAAYRQTEDSLEKMSVGHQKSWARFLSIQRRQHQLIKAYVNQIERGEVPSQVLPEPAAPSTSTVNESPEADRTIEGCSPRYFPEADRNKGHVIAIQDVKVDAKGRPWAWHALWSSPVTAGKRFPDCQATVGKMGKPTDVGGHMIGDRLGGWGKRANIVPQDDTLNGNTSGWNDIDATIAICAERGFMPDYTILAMYNDALKDTVRPISFTNVLSITYPTFPPEVKEGKIENQPNAFSVPFSIAMKKMAVEFKTVCSAGGGGCGLGEASCQL